MTPELWDRAKEISAEALERAPAVRRSYVAKSCGGNRFLQDEVEFLIAQEERIRSSPGDPTESLASSGAESRLELKDPFFELRRFRVDRRLGRGGFGTVYEVFDRERNEKVAVKVLNDSRPDLLARFRGEFRTMAKIRHPNLVRLGEFFSDNQLSFFTMELVHGVTFVDFVRPGGFQQACKSERLLSSFAQLCEGVSALHAANRLHRDLKPENVLVTDDGRVVILDFGLVQELSRFEVSRSVVGTPRYMAPEQGRGEAGRPADWFSVGVMLYESLTGMRPWSDEERRLGNFTSPKPPSEIVPGVGAAISELCIDLISPDPERRPSANKILVRVGEISGAATPEPAYVSTHDDFFVGRTEEIRTLKQLFRQRSPEITTFVNLIGPSGVGKSTLLRRFLDEVRDCDPNVVVLTGYCHLNETVPFKAFDAVVVALSRYLLRLPASEIEIILPRDAGFAARLFPVLQRVSAIASVTVKEHVNDSLDFRRRAFGALSELLFRLGMRGKSIVICLDDLQWGDLDSAALLKELLASPLFFIAGYRREDADTSPFLRAMQLILAEAVPAVRVFNMELAELRQEEALEMARKLLPVCDDVAPGLIAQESGGSPFLIDQYARHRLAMMRRDVHVPQFLELRSVIEERFAGLSPSAMILLRVIAVAGHPIPESVAQTAASITDYFATRDWLYSEAWIRLADVRGYRAIGYSHDKLCEIVLATIPAEQKTLIHERLANSFAAHYPDDPAILVLHLERAGRSEEAARRAIEAGDNAHRGLAFGKACELYQVALSVGGQSDADLFSLRGKLASALVSAGRGDQAAEQFVACAGHAAGETQRVDCLRRAADQYLRVGHIAKALDILRALAESAGIRLVETRWYAIVLLFFRRAILRVRGLGFHERQASAVPARALMELDVYWSLVVGFAMVDPVLSAAFGARHLILALRCGEPYRVGLSLALAAGNLAVMGERQSKTAWQICRTSTAIGLRISSPHVLGLAAVSAAACGSMTGRWRTALEEAQKAESILRQECAGAQWELTSARMFLSVSLYWIGEWRELVNLLEEAIRDATSRGDLYTETTFRLMTPSVIVCLAADRPEDARDQVAKAVRQWETMTGVRDDLPHLFGMSQLCTSLLYSGDASEAWKELDRHWDEIRRFVLTLRSDLLSTYAWMMRGRVAAAAAAICEPSRRGPLVAEVRRAAKWIARQRTPWGEGFVAVLNAFVAHTSGNVTLSLELLANAQAAFGAADMKMAARQVEWIRGSMIGGESGRRLVESAEAYMRQQGIPRPDRIAGMDVPGFVMAR
jgi:serine/threonine protein kinase